MQCFVHGNLAAAAVCKKCGKAMCVDCSAFANHSGLCPVCRRESVEGGLRKIQGLRRVRILVALIFSVFVLAGIASVYFFLWKNPLIFCAALVVPVIFIILGVSLKRLSVSERGLNANLAQINFALGRAPLQTGVINPLNPYQDVEACKPSRSAGHWACKCGAQNPSALIYCADCGSINPSAGSQLSFIEPAHEEIPEYKAGGAEEAEKAEIAQPIEEPTDGKKPAEAPSEGSDALQKGQAQPHTPQQSLDELQREASSLVAEDEIFEGQITFKELLEEILRELSVPVQKLRTRPAPRFAAQPQKEKAAEPKKPPAGKPTKPSKTKKPSQRAAAAQPKKPPVKAEIPPLHALIAEEEKMAEKERAEIRKELGKLREQINELYRKNT